METKITNEKQTQIIRELLKIANHNNILILFACESGSRAWGLESSDSDYDIRFIYIHPLSWYLDIASFSPPDTISLDIKKEKLDFSGWDLRKALSLFYGSNPPLLEWLNSPIIYHEFPFIISQMRELIPEYYSPTACRHHYLHMAQNNNRGYLQGSKIWIKKYFYVLRPILACIWIDSGYGPVPMKFETLLDHVIQDSSLLNAIKDLLKFKRSGTELDFGSPVPIISDFINKEISRLSSIRISPSKPKSLDPLNDIFLSAIFYTYGNEISALIKNNKGEF